MTRSNRDAIREAIMGLGPVADSDVPALAMRLSSSFTQSGLTIQMIEDEIRKLRAAEPSGIGRTGVGKTAP